MKFPRFRLSWVMVAVAIAAIDLWAIQAVIASREDRIRYVTGTFLLVGGLPMASVLAVGMLIRLRQSESRPFVLGFEVFGATALVSYVALAILPPTPDGPLPVYLSFFVKPIDMIMAQQSWVHPDHLRCRRNHVRLAATGLRASWRLSLRQVQSDHHKPLMRRNFWSLRRPDNKGASSYRLCAQPLSLRLSANYGTSRVSYTSLGFDRAATTENVPG